MQSLRLFHFSPGLQCYWSGNIHAGNSKDSQLWTVLSELPSISCTQHPFPPGMINNSSQPSSNGSPPPTIHFHAQPRAHELARMNDERMKGKSVRVNGEEPPKQPTRDVYIIT
jgi:hypothetical protein